MNRRTRFTPLPPDGKVVRLHLVGDRVVRFMLRHDIPVTRANYLRVAYGDTPPPDWTEGELPWYLQ